MRQRLTAGLVKSLTPQKNAYEVADTEVSGLTVMVCPGGTKTYFYRYRHPETRVMRRVKVGRADQLTVPQVRQMAQGYSRAVAAGTDPQQEKTIARAGTLREYLDGQYFEAIAHLKTREAIRASLKRDFKAFLNEPLAAITTWRLEKWRRARLDKGASVASCNRPLSYLRAMLTHAARAGLVKTNVARDIRNLREGETRVRFLTADERARLYAALEAREAEARAARVRYNTWLAVRGIDPLPLLEGRYCDHLYPLVVLALHTGLRRGELFRLAWRDVDMTRHMVTVRAENAKSGKPRHVPLNGPAMDCLDTWRAQQPDPSPGALVFPGKSGGVLDNIQTSWDGLRKAAGMPGLHFHDLRHDFASQLTMAGVSLAVVRELLGHADFETTLKYAHLAPETARAAVAELAGLPLGEAAPQEATG